jgi:hypothetical protein
MPVLDRIFTQSRLLRLHRVMPAPAFTRYNENALACINGCLAIGGNSVTAVQFYTMGANDNPNSVECSVPEKLPNGRIFFGPCMPKMRQSFRKRFLNAPIAYRRVTRRIFLVGINAKNGDQPRAVLWAGRLRAVMTFAEAHRRFRRAGEMPYSLHMRPLTEGGVIIGYKHRNKLHNRRALPFLGANR